MAATRQAHQTALARADSAMPMINGAHAIIFSKDAEADRAFLRDIIGLPSVDVGEGWLIFALPPSEVAVHPAQANGAHELYFMVYEVNAFVEAIHKRGIRCTPPRDLGWGVLTNASLPGGGTIGIYEPRHARPARPERARRPPKRRAVTARKNR